MEQDLTISLTPDEARRYTAAQLASGGLMANPAVETGPQNVQFGFRHGALETEHEAVVEVARVVEAIGVGDQRSGQRAEVEQTVPVGIVARQARDFQTQDDADPAHGDFGSQMGAAG